MPVYRALFTLSFDHSTLERGGLWIVPGKVPPNAATLEEMGRIARIAAPPLAVIPGWKVRSAKAKKNGIENAEQLLEMDTAEAAKLFKISTNQMAGWKAELINWLTIPPQEG